MNRVGKFTLGVMLLSGVAAAGYWFGTHKSNAQGAAASANQTERKVLYYRNPMGLPDTSPLPKKDAMGMDYVAVYAGDAESGGDAAINISVDKIQKLGVKSEVATMRKLNKILHVTGRIEIDERRTYTIAPKFEGWVEHLYVNSTGQPVSKGQILFDVYSPDLVSAQREQALAVQGLAALKEADDEAKQGMQRLAEASRTRLKNWDIAGAQSISSSNGDRTTVSFAAPVSGIVLEKKAVQGMRFMPGEMLYQIADLSSVWVIAEVPEQDIAHIQLGGHAQVGVDAYPERKFDGRVDFIYPTLDSDTRTVKVRMEISNPKGLLKPAMFASAQLAAGKGDPVLTVPTSAVIDSGTHQVVLVRLAEGRFEPRTVNLGSRSNDYIEILDGVAQGEQVVTAANFLIDAESNLKAALSGLGTPAIRDAAPNADSKPVAPIAEDHTKHNVQSQPTSKVGSVGNQAHGTLLAINPDSTVNIKHGAIASLGWPAMTMDFALANAALIEGVQPGSNIDFEIVERQSDEWVITKLQVQPHEGH